MVLKELIFNAFLLQKGVVVLKEMIFNIFYCWEGRGGLERNDF